MKLNEVTRFNTALSKNNQHFKKSAFLVYVLC